MSCYSIAPLFKLLDHYVFVTLLYIHSCTSVLNHIKHDLSSSIVKSLLGIEKIEACRTGGLSSHSM